MYWTSSDEGNTSMIRVDVTQIWNPGFFFFQTIIFYIKVVYNLFLIFKDLFLINALDSGSWNQWGTNSNY